VARRTYRSSLISRSLANLQSFYQHVVIFQPFILQKSSLQREITAVGHAIDLAAAASQPASTVSPLLNLSHPHIFRFRSHIMTFSSTKNMALRFKDILPSGTNTCEGLGVRRDGPDVACGSASISALTSSSNYGVTYFTNEPRTSNHTLFVKIDLAISQRRPSTLLPNFVYAFSGPF